MNVMSEFKNKYKCINCNHCFKHNTLFQLLKQKEVEFLNTNRLEVDFKAGEIICKQGTPLTHVVLLNHGLGKAYIEGHKGRNLIISLTGPYEINGGPGMYVDMRHHYSVMALVDCSVCFIDANSFKGIIRKNPIFADAFLRECSSRTLYTFNRFLILTQKNMEGRIAEAIIYLHENVYNNGKIEYLTKQDFAELTGMTKESAIRVMKDFKDEGIILEEHNTIDILNEKALRQIAANG